MGVIHFADLDELIEELVEGQTVRVAVLDLTESISKDYGIRQAGIGVHVRAFDGDGHVLACYVQVVCLQMIGNTALSDPGGGKPYSAAWEKAEGEAGRVRKYLAGRGFDVRPGVIEIGDARPLAGDWSGDV